MLTYTPELKSVQILIKHLQLCYRQRPINKHKETEKKCTNFLFKQIRLCLNTWILKP